MEGDWKAYEDGCKIRWRQEIIHHLVQEKNQSFQGPLSPTCCHHKRWSLSGASASRRDPASYLLPRNGCALPDKLPEASWETNMLMDFENVIWLHPENSACWFPETTHWDTLQENLTEDRWQMPWGLTQLKRQRRKLKKSSPSRTRALGAGREVVPSPLPF